MNKKVKMLATQFMTLCFLFFMTSLSQAADVTLTVGNGSGFIGQHDISSVEVSLANPNNRANGIQLHVRDEDDYLTCTECVPNPVRAPGYSCSASEQTDGHCEIILYTFGAGVIEKGDGPVLTLTYNVSGDAPEECRDLFPEEVKIPEAAPQYPELEVTSVSGEFCFESCTADVDCADTLYCNGDEGCTGGICIHLNDPCPGQMCDEESHECVECLHDADCSNGLYCDGFETCDENGYCQDGGDPCTDNGLYCDGEEGCDEEYDACTHTGNPCLPFPGTICVEAADSCETTTTSTISTITTTVPTTTSTSMPPISTTTTTAATSSCQVSVSPLSSTLISGTSMQFSARTECDGEEVEGIYGWQIVPDSTIGSAIDGDGLFTAGDNTTDSDVDETVRVTDTAHGNESATANITIKVKQTPVGCEVEISPLAATVSPGDTVTLIANSIGDCDTPLYAWALTTETDSLYEPQGGACDYTAGANDGTELLTDVMTVSDTVNGVGAEATITIQAEGVSMEVSPENLWRSHFLPLPYLIVIKGEGTHFKAFDTNLSFDPPEAVFPFWPIVLGHSSIWDIILVMPSGLAGAEDQTVTVTVATGDEVVSDAFTLKLLPFILDQNRSLR